MARADWNIDLGLAADHDGGPAVFEGTPADLASTRSTLIGKHLATCVGV
jgi:excinuclease UvrABC ATPase subunit